MSSDHNPEPEDRTPKFPKPRKIFKPGNPVMKRNAKGEILAYGAQIDATHKSEGTNDN